MNPVLEAAVEVQQFMQQRKWDFCIIGGLALMRWGSPRTTQDVDATLLTGFGDERRYVEEVLAHFSPRISDAEQFALTSRVLLIKATNGVPVDLSLGGIDFEENEIRRATPFEFAPGAEIVTCSAEDLVVMKAFADRQRDWADVEGVLIRQGRNLDWDYILEQLKPLCELKDAPGIVDRLEELRESLSRE